MLLCACSILTIEDAKNLNIARLSMRAGTRNRSRSLDICSGLSVAYQVHGIRVYAISALVRSLCHQCDLTCTC